MAGREIAIGVGVTLIGAFVGGLIGWWWAQEQMSNDALKLGLDLLPTFFGFFVGGAVGWWIAKLWMK